MHARGCITHSIFSNGRDFHILAMHLLGNEKEGDDGRQVVVFKSWPDSKLPTIGTGEWIEVCGNVEHHSRYGAQIVVTHWTTIDCDEPKPKRKKKDKGHPVLPRVKQKPSPTSQETMFGNPEFMFPNTNEDFGEPPEHFTEESEQIYNALLNDAPDY